MVTGVEGLLVNGVLQLDLDRYGRAVSIEVRCGGRWAAPRFPDS
jgi:hypothetical protein